MKIRLWKLGSVEHKIFPTPQAIKKLREALTQNSDGVIDIIWDDGLTVQEIEVKDGDLEVLSAATPSGYKLKTTLYKENNENPQV